MSKRYVAFLVNANTGNIHSRVFCQQRCRDFFTSAEEADVIAKQKFKDYGLTDRHNIVVFEEVTPQPEVPVVKLHRLTMSEDQLDVIIEGLREQVRNNNADDDDTTILLGKLLESQEAAA